MQGRVRRGRFVSCHFSRLIVHNLATRKARTILTTTAVALSVMANTLSVVTESLQESAASILQAGRADFTFAQMGAPDTLDSVVTDTQVSQVAATPGVQSAVGALVTTTNVDASHPQFLEIGIAPSSLSPFGVKVVASHSQPTGSETKVSVPAPWFPASPPFVDVQR